MGSATWPAPAMAGAVLAGIALIILTWRVAGARDPAAAVRRLAGDMLVGTVWILAVNLAASPAGLHVGWNPLAALIAGALGLPGVAAMVILRATAMALP
ncbi:MAG TPA: pro-sigmaK processing inhibitor BofA family protein [Thermaerobacter sp.]